MRGRMGIKASRKNRRSNPNPIFSGSAGIDLTENLYAYYNFRSQTLDVFGTADGTPNGGLTEIELPDTTKKGYDFNIGWIDLPTTDFYWKKNDFTIVQNIKAGTGGKSYSHQWGHIAWGPQLCQVYYFGAGGSEIVNVSIPGLDTGEFVQVAWVKSSTTGNKVYINGVLAAHDPAGTGDLYGSNDRIACIGKTGSLPFDHYNGGIYDQWSYFGEVDEEKLAILASDFGFGTDFLT